jgi:hypothetical protein
MSKKEHQKYYVNGRQVPSVTQIIDVNLGRNKNALIAWARKEAMAGRDPTKVKEKAGDVGTIAHALIHEHLTGIHFDRSDYLPMDIDIAKNAFIAYLQWEQDQDLSVCSCELPLVHEELLYGGTIDLLADLNGRFTLIDFKSSNRLYAEHRIQVAAYRELIHHVYDCYPDNILLHLNKETGLPTLHELKDLSKEWEVFQHLLEINKLWAFVV